jgi:hypothetical protein
MARREADREDLIADAVALIHRAEFLIVGCPEPIVVGCRATGAWSFYFGAEPVYQFEPDGSLRRAFVDGKLYRTQGTTMAELTRVRTDAATTLERRDLTEEEAAAFRDRIQRDLVLLQNQLWEEKFRVLRMVGFDVPPRSAVADALHSILDSGIRFAPPVPTRKA